MTTARFNKLAGPTSRAMAEAYQRVKDGQAGGTFACPTGCGGTVRYSGNVKMPHRTAGSCNTTGCIRWAVQ